MAIPIKTIIIVFKYVLLSLFFLSGSIPTRWSESISMRGFLLSLMKVNPYLILSNFENFYFLNLLVTFVYI